MMRIARAGEDRPNQPIATPRMKGRHRIVHLPLRGYPKSSHRPGTPGRGVEGEGVLVPSPHAGEGWGGDSITDCTPPPQPSPAWGEGANTAPSLQPLSPKYGGEGFPG